MHVVESSKLFFSKVREFVPPSDRTVRRTSSRAIRTGSGSVMSFIQDMDNEKIFWNIA